MSHEQHQQRRLHTLVSGQVQGVGFRYHVLTEVRARCPNVSGWVRNRYDGRVELIAEGPEDELRQVLTVMRRGPRWAVVKAVDETWGNAQGDLGRRFDVSHDDGSVWKV